MGDLNPYLTRGSLVHATQHSKRHLDRFSLLWAAHGRQSLYFTMGPSPKIALPMENLDPM